MSCVAVGPAVARSGQGIAGSSSPPPISGTNQGRSGEARLFNDGQWSPQCQPSTKLGQLVSVAFSTFYLLRTGRVYPGRGDFAIAFGEVSEIELALPLLVMTTGVDYHFGRRP